MPTLSVKVVNSQWPTFGLEFDVVFKIVDLSALRIPITPISAIIFNSNILTQVYPFLKNIGFLIILVKKKKYKLLRHPCTLFNNRMGPVLSISGSISYSRNKSFLPSSNLKYQSYCFILSFREPQIFAFPHYMLMLYL